MKKLLFTLLLIVCLALSNAQAQCAVYFEEETGIWGAQWDNGKPPYATIDEVKAAAKKSCEGSGGKNCQLFYAGFETGWWVVVLGKARKGNEEGYHLFRVMYFETENTAEAKAAAEKRAIEVFMEQEGNRPTNSENVQSWYVPKKQE